MKLSNERKFNIAIIFVIASFFLWNYGPVERLIKLSERKRELRAEHLKSVTNIIENCQRLNSRYTRSNSFSTWYESLRSFGAWYEWVYYPRITVSFNAEEMRNDSYCEVLIGLNEPEYEFYKYEYFSQGFDQYDEERIVGFRDHFCDDRNGENYTYGRCSR